MRGHVRKRGNGWNIRRDLGPHPETGRLRQKWYSSCTRREAERKLVEVLARLNRGRHAIEPSKMRLGDYLSRWMRDYA